MDVGSPVHEIGPGEGYDIDSEGYDSDEERENLNPAEYDQLVEEAENGFMEEEVQEMIARLKEQGLVTFLREYLQPGKDGELPSLRKLLIGFGIIPPISLRHPSTPNLALLRFTQMALSRILRRRDKLPQYNTVDDAVRLLGSARNIIVLSGAGISTSCGIPDFRSSSGLYAQLQAEGKYDLDDPQQMFDIAYFREHPEVFYSFAKQIYPSNFTPSPCHRWIKTLEDKGVLLRNYTQNIDTLESLAGVTKVLQCHGSFKTASCLRCKTRVPGQTIEPNIMSQTVPYCEPCRITRQDEIARIKATKANRRKAKGKGKASGWGGESDGTDDEDEDEWGAGEPGIFKPDITFFGQALDSEFDQCLWRDREKVDLLVIVGTSLKVAPVSEVLAHIPHSVPQIFINLTPVHHVHPDISLLGDADTIVKHLSDRLGWTIPPPPVSGTSTIQVKSDLSTVNSAPTPGQSGDDLIWVSGPGDLPQHAHVLMTQSEKNEMDRILADLPDPNPTLDSRLSETPTVDLARSPDEDGDGEDERPFKRTKTADML